MGFYADIQYRQMGKWQILDSKTGDIYNARLTLIEGGKKLKVRGYWGIFWRTQTWIRAE